MKRDVNTDYKQHFENGPIPMWIIDAKTMQFLVVNNAAVVQYGYSKEEFSNLTILDIRPKGDIALTVDNYTKRENDYYDAGYRRHMRKDGTVFFVHIYSHSTQYGERQARLCFAIDINDKVLAERRNIELLEILKEQKADLDNILYSINDAIWSRNAGTHELLYGNMAYYRLYEVAPEQMGTSIDYFLESVYPPDLKILTEAIHEVNTTGKTEAVYRQIKKDGRIRTYKTQATLKKGSDGKPDIITGITTDISHEKELFDAIRSSEQKLLATINNTQDMIWSVDSDLKITFCNTAYQDFFLKSSGMALDAGDYVLGNWYSESFISRRKKDYERALNGERFITIVGENLNGVLQYNEISSNPVIDLDGRIIGVNCIARDISEQRRQLINIREQNEILKEIAWKKMGKVNAQVSDILESNSNEGLKTVTENLDQIIKEIVSVSKNIDANFPDTQDIISRL